MLYLQTFIRVSISGIKCPGTVFCFTELSVLCILEYDIDKRGSLCKKRLKILTAVVLELLLALLAAGCGAASIPKPQPTQGAKTVTVTGNCDLEIEDTTIIVSGETDLIDGALLHVSVVSQDGMIVDSVKLTKAGIPWSSVLL